MPAPTEILDRRNEIKRCVAQAEFEPALGLLLDFVKDYNPALEDDAIVISSRYYSVTKAVKRGDTEWSDGEKRLSGIATTILDILRNACNALPQT